MRRRNPRWIWTGRILFVLIGAALATYLVIIGLDRADKTASVIGAILALLALGAPYLLPPSRPESASRSLASSVDVARAVSVSGTGAVGVGGDSGAPITTSIVTHYHYPEPPVSVESGGEILSRLVERSDEQLVTAVLRSKGEQIAELLLALPQERMMTVLEGAKSLGRVREDNRSERLATLADCSDEIAAGAIVGLGGDQVAALLLDLPHKRIRAVLEEARTHTLGYWLEMVTDGDLSRLITELPDEPAAAIVAEIRRTSGPTHS
jgi:hypothetical protein